jgi:hypothetical protein
MALSRVKVWTAEELTSSDLNAEFNNILNNATSLISPLTANLAAGGFRLTGLSAGSVGSPTLQPTGDTDTGIYFPGANQVGIAGGGTAVLNIFGGQAAANTYLYGLYIAPVYTEATSGTHPVESSLFVNTPTITGGVATATLGATVYIVGATAGTVTAANYALYVNAGNVRINDELFLGANQVSAGDLVDATKLSVGTTGQVLRMGATAPAWGTAGSEWYTPHGLTLSNNAGDATNDIDIAIGDANSDDASPIDREVIYLAAGLTKKLDTTWVVGTNQGMLASGAALADGTYHIFLIKRPDTGVVDIAADSSATGANVFANTNVAYTKKRRIGSILRRSAALELFVQDANLFVLKVPISTVDDTNPGTNAVTKTLPVVTGIKVEALLSVLSGGHAGSLSRSLISDLAQTDSAPTTGLFTLVQPANGAYASGVVRVMTNTSGQVRTRLNASDGSTKLEIGTNGWVDTRSA